jgi:hypothetical protein
VSRQDNYRHIVVDLLDPCEQLEAINIRKAQVEQNQFRRILSDYRKCLCAGLGFEHTITVAFKQPV